MAKMPTKKQRIKELTDAGMSRVEAEAKFANERLDAQNQKIEDAAQKIVMKIVKRDYEEIWELAMEEARESVVGRPKRSRKASADAATEASAEASTDAAADAGTGVSDGSEAPQYYAAGDATTSLQNGGYST